jgi:hypothetical protein
MSLKTTTHLTFFFAVLISSSSFAEGSKSCSMRRLLSEKDGKTIYTVGDRARSLYMIARDLYGDEKYWIKIAQWNKLAAPYTVHSGQHLVIDETPAIDEEKSNETLIKAWGNLKNKSMVSKISSYKDDFEKCNPKKEEPVVEAAPPMTPVSEAPVEPVKKIEAIVDTPQTEPHEEHGEEFHPEWNYSATLTSSMFHLTSEEDESHDIDSKINYGVDLGIHYEKTEKWTFSLGVGIEHLDLKQPSDPAFAFDKTQQDLLSFSIDADYKVSPHFTVYFGANYGQHAFYRVTDTGATMDPIYLPEINVGDELHLFDARHLETWLVTELSYSFPVKSEHHDVKPGYGYVVGFKFEYKFDHSAMNIMPAYRFAKEDTETAKEEQRAYLLNIGFEW